MNIQILANILKFLEKAPAIGLESYAWVDAHRAIQSEINRLMQAELVPPTKE